MNYFDSASSAERYRNGRPDFHAGTIKRIRTFLNIENRLDKALDIACGTGLSTKALLPVAEKVFGTDASRLMINVACEKGRITYAVSAAEHQPFGKEELDLVTVCSGVHWFDIDAFLKEVDRILKKDAWLVLYENYFAGEMEDVKEFGQWVKEVYLQRFPSPPRNKDYAWTPENLEGLGFSIYPMDRFNNTVELSKRQLIGYFTTQSNTIAVTLSGSADYAEIESWLENELSVFFTGPEQKRALTYGNWIRYLQKTDLR